LTKGDFGVTRIVSIDGKHTNEEILRLASTLE